MTIMTVPTQLLIFHKIYKGKSIRGRNFLVNPETKLLLNVYMTYKEQNNNITGSWNIHW